MQEWMEREDVKCRRISGLARNQLIRIRWWAAVSWSSTMFDNSASSLWICTPQEAKVDVRAVAVLHDRDEVRGRILCHPAATQHPRREQFHPAADQP